MNYHVCLYFLAESDLADVSTDNGHRHTKAPGLLLHRSTTPRLFECAVTKWFKQQFCGPFASLGDFFVSLACGSAFLCGFLYVFVAVSCLIVVSFVASLRGFLSPILLLPKKVSGPPKIQNS